MNVIVKHQIALAAAVLGRPLTAAEEDAIDCRECPGCGRDRMDFAFAGAPDALCGWLDTTEQRAAWKRLLEVTP